MSSRYLVLPMGEAAGISPELILKALNDEKRRAFGRVIVVGDKMLFRKVSKDLDIPLPFTSFVESDGELVSSIAAGEETIFYNLRCIDLEKFRYGQLSADTGLACYAVTAKAVNLIQNSYGSVLVTPPLDARQGHGDA